MSMFHCFFFKQKTAYEMRISDWSSDVCSSDLPADSEAMKSDPDINLLQQEGLNVGYLAYNTQEPPFDNVKVREALNMAINKQAIIDAVFQGAGKVAKNPIPPTIWSYNDAVKDEDRKSTRLNSSH